MSELFDSVLAQVEAKAREQAERDWVAAVAVFTKATAIDLDDVLPECYGRAKFIDARVKEARDRFARKLAELAAEPKSAYLQTPVAPWSFKPRTDYFRERHAIAAAMGRPTFYGP